MPEKESKISFQLKLSLTFYPIFFKKNGGEIERKRWFSGFVLFWKNFLRGINVRNLKIKELSTFEK